VYGRFDGARMHWHLELPEISRALSKSMPCKRHGGEGGPIRRRGRTAMQYALLLYSAPASFAIRGDEELDTLVRALKELSV